MTQRDLVNHLADCHDLRVFRLAAGSVASPWDGTFESLLGRRVGAASGAGKDVDGPKRSRKRQSAEANLSDGDEGEQDSFDIHEGAHSFS